MQQRTLANHVVVTGIGLHSGRPVTLELHPADIDSGIQFIRTDLATQAQPIIARYDQVTDTQMSSNLTNAAQQRVGTVEHLISSIAALGIDNLLIKVSAAEVPIMDGSALPYVQLIKQAGIQQQPAAKRFIKILRPISVTLDDKSASFTPANRFYLDFTIDFAHPAILPEHSHYQFELSSQGFAKQIAPARTFGFLKDIDYLKSQNLGLGGSMDNAIVFDDQTVLNPDGLRTADELVKHKILDAIGDLYLAGHQILADFHAYKSGHYLNNLLLRAVFSDAANYQIVTKYDDDTINIDYDS